MPGSEKHLVAWRLLQPLDQLLHTLRRPDQHGNRTLFADQLLIAHLVAFFSPALKSLRRIEDVFNHPGARRKYDLPRLPHSTLSAAQALFDPALLTPLVTDLKQRIGVSPHEPRLDELTRKRLAVDGSFFALAPRVTWALYNKPNPTPRPPQPRRRRGDVRVDFHFDVLAGVPEADFVTGGRTPEYQTLVEHLQAGVVACQTVRACGPRGAKALGERPLRLVTLSGPEGEPLRLLTNLLNLAPDLLGLVYRHRWKIELFFRWLKCLVNFRHFFAESENGVAWQKEYRARQHKSA